MRCFVIGHPIAHSRSPMIHRAWLRQYGLSGTYDAIDVAPSDIPAFMQGLREGAYTGGNVTLPHKEAVIPFVDEIGPAGRAIGAVNTIWQEGGRLIADNTDVMGFIGHLDASVPGWQDRTATALVLGAGGAAKGICYGLIQRGVERIIVVNRGRERADELAAALGKSIIVREWRDAPGAVAEADLIVNTTALGMNGQPQLDLDLSLMKPGTIVDDIVYVPLKTALLIEAEQRGGIAVDGLGMLLHQAVPGFAHWFGVTPAVTPALRAPIEADILRV